MSADHSTGFHPALTLTSAGRPARLSLIRPKTAQDAAPPPPSYWTVDSALSSSTTSSSASLASSAASTPSSVFFPPKDDTTITSERPDDPRGSKLDRIVSTTLTADPVPGSAGDIFSPRPPSHDGIPRQTLLKALASVANKSNKRNPKALSLPSMCGGSDDGGADVRRHNSASPRQPQPRQLGDALGGHEPTPTTALPLAALKSPCFYHERLDDAVDISSILDAVRHDGSMSHSHLVRTATTVRQVSKQLRHRPIRRAVRNVMIITKARDNHLVYLTRELTLWLLRTPRYGSDLGVNVFVDAKLRTSRRFGADAIVAEDPRFASMLAYWTPDMCWTRPETFDLVLTLGGDGTVLFTSWLFQRIVPPVLSFALGSLGFLTSFEFERYKDHLDRVMGDEGMRVNLRMRFTCTVFRSGTTTTNKGEGQEEQQPPTPQEAEQFEVLNELVIDRGPSPYVSNLELYGDDELLTVIQADGCIFSTPTGSTAYSLSAGGSLVHPDIPCIMLTPICPHTLSFRPMVLSDTMALRVAVPPNSRATAYCAFDGKGRVELRQGDYVTITASQYPFPTVTRADTEWFDSVSRTLRWNTRAATQKAFDASAAVAAVDEQESAVVVKGEPEWDIDFDADSACYASEDGSSKSASPLRKMSLLGI